MRIQHLRVQAFRRFSDAEVTLAPGFNSFVGANGSGKTTLLEANHLLAHGRSFRGRVRDGLIQTHAAALWVNASWETAGISHRAGLRHSGNQWEAKLDGAPLQQLGQLCEALAVVSFEPGSHALVDGSSQLRRRFLDWGVFHVEHLFMQEWRRFARALKQRNALLRQPGAQQQLAAWEGELAEAGERLTLQREAYLAQLQLHISTLTPKLLPSAGEVRLRLQPGWRRETMSLADALLLSRERDLAIGHTSQGPHRADIRIELQDLPAPEQLSRGQTKQLALLLLLGQAMQLAEALGHWPVLQLDDLGSELDRYHQECVLDVLSTSGAQVLVTGTEVLPAWDGLGVDVTMFHVEHGAVHTG